MASSRSDLRPRWLRCGSPKWRPAGAHFGRRAAPNSETESVSDSETKTVSDSGPTIANTVVGPESEPILSSESETDFGLAICAGFHIFLDSILMARPFAWLPHKHWHWLGRPSPWQPIWASIGLALPDSTCNFACARHLDLLSTPLA